MPAEMPGTPRRATCGRESNLRRGRLASSATREPQALGRLLSYSSEAELLHLDREAVARDAQEPGGLRPVAARLVQGFSDEAPLQRVHVHCELQRVEGRIRSALVRLRENGEGDHGGVDRLS